jgi:hypothetical protein
MKKKLSKFHHVQRDRDDGVVDFAHLANLYVSFGAYAYISSKVKSFFLKLSSPALLPNFVLTAIREHCVCLSTEKKMLSMNNSYLFYCVALFLGVR